MSESHTNEGSVRAILFAFSANLGIAITKFAAAFFTGSGSMLAEAIHSTADCANQMLLFMGLKKAARPPDARHPLGYGKAVYFWSFMVAILLFSMGGIVSLYEGVHKWMHPEPLHDAWIALIVICISILLEGGSLLGALRETNRLRGTTPVLRWIASTRRAELLVVLGEDVAAITGLILAGAFLSLAVLSGNPLFDAAGSIAIGVLLVVISVGLSSRIKSMLLGESADPEIEAAIQEHVVKDPFIERLLHLITAQLGPDIMVACKVEVRKDLSVDQAIEAVNGFERTLKERIPEVRWSFVEIDRED